MSARVSGFRGGRRLAGPVGAASETLAATRWLLVVLGALAGCHKGDSDSDAGPSMSLVASEMAEAPLSVQGTSSEDVWMVGSDAGGVDGPLALHWDGSAWERVTTGSPGDLWWSWPTDRTVTMVGAGGRILELDRENGQFTTFATDPAITFFGVWGSSPEDVWAVGGDVSGGVAPEIWHRDASGWAQYHDATVDAVASPNLFYKVHGTSSGDVWVVGTNATALHFEGSSFTRTTVPGGGESPLFTVWATPTPIAVGGFGQALAVSWDGSGWVDHTPSFTPQLNGVSSDGTTTVAVGAQGTVVRWDGTAWTPDATKPTVYDLHSTWVDDSGAIWAVGGALSSTPLTHGVIVYDGAAEVPAP